MELFKQFIDYLSKEKRYSLHTITAYSGDLVQFENYLMTNFNLDLNHPVEISHSFIRSWIVDLMEQGTSPRSINRKLSTLKSYFKYLLRNNVVQDSPLQKITALRVSKRLPVFIESDKAEMLFNEVLDMGKNYANKNFDVKFFINLSRIFKSYGLMYTKEFNNMCMSIQITNSVGLALSPKINKIQVEIMNEFVKINKLIEIED